MTNSKTTTVAATMEPALSRRRVLLGLGAATATAAVIATPRPAEPAMIDDPFERVRYHADQLAAALALITPTHDFFASIDKDHEFAVVGSRRKDAPPPKPVFDGPGAYEVELENGKRPIYWLERFDYVSTAGHYYTAQHYWNKKRQGMPRRLREKQIKRFVRKIDGGFQA